MLLLVFTERKKETGMLFSFNGKFSGYRRKKRTKRNNRKTISVGWKLYPGIEGTGQSPDAIIPGRKIL
jgi:hypothetical protein